MNWVQVLEGWAALYVTGAVMFAIWQHEVLKGVDVKTTDGKKMPAVYYWTTAILWLPCLIWLVATWNKNED